MTKYAGVIILIFLQLIGCVSMIREEKGNRPSKQEEHVQPPPETIVACKGKSEGVSVKFTAPRGDTLKGVCKQFEGILTAMPERGALPPQGGRPNEYNRGQQSD